LGQISEIFNNITNALILILKLKFVLNNFVYIQNYK
jgi:hypothetical protein